MVECECLIISFAFDVFKVLIDTWWNVNDDLLKLTEDDAKF